MLLIGNGCFGELSIILRLTMVCVYFHSIYNNIYNNIAILIVYHTTWMTHVKIKKTRIANGCVLFKQTTGW